MLLQPEQLDCLVYYKHCYDLVIKDIVTRNNPNPQTVKKTRCKYTRNSPQLKRQIVFYAMVNGSANALIRFNMPETKRSTIDTWIKQYEKIKDPAFLPFDSPDVRTGRKVIYGNDIEHKLYKAISDVRSKGAGVHWSTVVTFVKAFILSEKRQHILTVNGGDFKASKSWAYDWLKRNGFTIRQCTGSKVHQEADEAISTKFLYRVTLAVIKYAVQKSLVVNMDETGLQILPVMRKTFHKKGALSVILKYSNDKRQITAVMSGTASGDLLPVQLIFQGKTSRVHPSKEAPTDCLYFHTPNHWSNEQSMIEYIHNIIVPYRKKVIEEEGLSDEQKIILILDVY